MMNEERITLDVIDPRITCDACGACCMSMRSPPFIPGWEEEDAWLAAAPEEARRVFDDGLDDGPDDSPCSWLDLTTKRCRWHEHRPGICRDFPVGGESCRAYRVPCPECGEVGSHADDCEDSIDTALMTEGSQG